MSSFKDLLDLSAELPAHVPLFLLGRPGIGKSALAQAVASVALRIAKEAKGYFAGMDRWELTSHEPTDVGGIPFMRDGYTYFCPPHRLAKFAAGAGPDGEDPYAVLIFEDITQAQRGTQNAVLQLVQEGSIGELQLSPNVRIILTGNRVSDKAGARELPSPLKNRVMLLSLEPDLEEWMYWAAAQKLPAVVGSFLQYKPSLFSLLPSQADKENGQFATPRSWANVGSIYEACIKHGKGELGPLYMAASGLVGTGTATEFVAFVRLQKELPNPKAVLDDPEKALPNPPDEPDRLAAMVTALGEYAAIHQTKDKKIYIKLLLALAHVSQKSREGCAAGVSVFQANGGDVGKLVDAADKHKKDPRVLSVLKFFAEATK
jgi:hypothetical protein